MNNTEISALLAKIQLDDNRDITPQVIARWTEIFTPVHETLPDLLEAVNIHRRESIAYLQPAHVIANLRRIHEERSRGHALDEQDRDHTFMSAPKPHNFDEMSAAWNDPVRFGVEVAKYRAQVADGLVARATRYEHGITNNRWEDA